MIMIDKMNNSIKFRTIDWLVLLFFIWGYGRITTSEYRPILFLAGCLVLLKLSKSLVKLLKDKVILFYIAFLIYFCLFLPFDSSPRLSLSYFGMYFLYIIPYFIMVYYTYYRYNIKLLKTINKLLIYYLIILGLASVVYYFFHPGIARFHATHRSDMDGLMIGGGYQLAYVYALTLPVIVQNYIKRKEKKYILLFCFSVLLLWMTNSLITLLAGLIGVGWCIISNGNRKSIIFKRLLFLYIFILLTIFIESMGSILVFISQNKEVTGLLDYDNSIYIRLKEIGLFLKNGDLTELEAFRLRYENFVLPFDSIVSNPITGNLLKEGINPENAVFNDSSIITAASCWGIPMALLYLVPFFVIAEKYSIYNGTTLVFLLLMLLNPSEGFSVYGTVLFFIPSLSFVEMMETQVVN